MRTAVRFLASSATALALAVPAWAQPTPQAHDWGHGTTLTGFAGVAVDSSRNGPIFGGSIGWELTPRVAIEGTGLWVDHAADAHAFAGALKVRAAVLGPRTVVPFVEGGIGLYRASLDRTQTRIPRFYRHRMDREETPFGIMRSYTDPTVVFGTGADVFLSRNLAIRPDVEVMVALRDSRSHVVTAFRIGMVYHIEDHPVTPARAGR